MTEKGGSRVKFGYAAEGMSDVVEHVRKVLPLKGRDHRSRGMKSVHDAYVKGYNEAIREVTEIMEQTRFIPADE